MISIIDRYEQKYFLDNNQFKKLIILLGDKLHKDQYFSETIYNIYFDNDSYELINRSMEKPEYKEKLRLRSYNQDILDKEFFLEIKKKYEMVTNKRRIVLKYNDYMNYLKKGIIPDHNKQIMREIDYCFKKYQLKPKVKVRYDRLSYYLENDESFRITFDNNVQYNFHNLAFNNNESDKLLFKGGYIMEIKSFNGIPLWLNRVLTNLSVFPISFSKIGKIFEKEGVI